MAYETKVSIPPRPVGRNDIVFEVRKEGARFGRLKVSKGAAVWLPGNKQKGYRLNWQEIDDLFRDWGHRGDFPI